MTRITFEEARKMLTGHIGPPITQGEMLTKVEEVLADAIIKSTKAEMVSVAEAGGLVDPASMTKKELATAMVKGKISIPDITKP